MESFGIEDFFNFPSKKFNPDNLVNEFKTGAFLAVTQFKEANQGKYSEELLNEDLSRLYDGFDKALKQYYQNIKLYGNKSVIDVQPTISREKLEVELEKLSASFQEFLNKIERD